MNQKQRIVAIIDRHLIGPHADACRADLYWVAQQILNALDEPEPPVTWPGFFEPQPQKTGVWARIRHKLQTFNVWIGKSNKEGVKV